MLSPETIETIRLELDAFYQEELSKVGLCAK